MGVYGGIVHAPKSVGVHLGAKECVEKGCSDEAVASAASGTNVEADGSTVKDAVGLETTLRAPWETGSAETH